VSTNSRLVGLSIFNASIAEGGTRLIAIVDRIPLSMRIFGSNYNRLFNECWTTVDSRNGFKSLSCINSEENAPGHDNRLNKFGGHPIEERRVE
jgi:hypothetical protein